MLDGWWSVAPNFDPFHAFSRLGLAFLELTLTKYVHTTPKAHTALAVL